MDAKEERERGEVEDERCKGKESEGSEVQNLECHEKLELEVLELEIALERRRGEARAWRKQIRMEKLEELVGLVQNLEELERQRARVESVRRNLRF